MDRLRKIWHLPFDLGKDSIDTPDKHTTVPRMVACAQKLIRCRLVRLLFELIHVVNRIFILAIEGLALLDVSISRGWECGCDPQGNQVTFRCHVKRGADQVPE